MLPLHLKYRPKTLGELVGQAAAVRSLGKMVDDNRVPHAVLFSGPAGTGKTSAARVLADVLDCDVDSVDFVEVNCASCEPLETVRGIQAAVHYTGLGGTARVWLLDEFQAMSRAGFAQQGLLKLLEEPPAHAYFFLCTTDPSKIIPTIRSRCTEVKLQPIGPADLRHLLSGVCMKEKVKLTENVADRIVELADGSARKALVLLEQVGGVEGEKERLDCLIKSGARTAGFDLAKALLPFRGQTPWPEVARLLKGLEGEEPEGIRRLVLAVARTALLRGDANSGRAAAVIQSFRDHVFDSGHAGLAVACWEIAGKNGR